MRESPFSPPSQPTIDRPNCPKCGAKMWLARIEPAGEPGYDVRTFECPKCNHSENVTTKFR